MELTNNEVDLFIESNFKAAVTEKIFQIDLVDNASSVHIAWL